MLLFYFILFFPLHIDRWTDPPTLTTFQRTVIIVSVNDTTAYPANSYHEVTVHAPHNRNTSIRDRTYNMGLRSLNFFARLKISKKPHYYDQEVKSEKNMSHVQEGKCFIIDLPTELLALISAQLDPLSEACLALTCRRLLLISGASLVSTFRDPSNVSQALLCHGKSISHMGTNQPILLSRRGCTLAC